MLPPDPNDRPGPDSEIVDPGVQTQVLIASDGGSTLTLPPATKHRSTGGVFTLDGEFVQ